MISSRPAKDSLRFRRLARAGALLFPALVTTGCFTFRPLASGEPPPTVGTRIHADLTRDGREYLEDRTGRDAESVNGILVAESADSLWLDQVIPGQLTAAGQTVRDTIPVPRGEVVEMRVRSFSLVRTTVLSAVLAGAAVWAIDALAESRSEGNGDGRQPPNLIRIPFFHLIH